MLAEATRQQTTIRKQKKGRRASSEAILLEEKCYIWHPSSSVRDICVTVTNI